MRVGVIGCGKVSERHIVPIRRQAGVEIVGVADTDEERAREIAHRFGIRYVFRDAAAMLRERRPDVVHILTPPQSHKELSIQAMEAGCNVLVEKPMAVCVSEADEMIAASRRHGVTLGVCHNLLFIPAVMEALELAATGVLGTIIGTEVFWKVYRYGTPDKFRTTKWFYELPGGIYHEAAPHPVYLQMEFLNTLHVVSAQAKKTVGDLPTPSDELRVLFNGESGLGSLSISSSAEPYLVCLNIFGSAMSLQVNLVTNTLIKHRIDGLGMISKALVNIDHSLQLMSKTVINSILVLLGRMTLGHGVLIEKFYESLRNGTDPPVTGEDGRAVVAVLDQIWAKLDKTHTRGEAE
jgi:predicted dehydrogenase